MTVAKKRISKILAFALLLLIGGQLFLSAFSIKASAAETTYSNVLDDLEKDDDFNPDDYPAVPNDYSLKVIQIAEGENGELFVYVYQPSQNQIALKLSMSLNKRASDFKLFDLVFLNSDGVFHKYKVADFKISNDDVRYYEIASIFRAFDENIDNSVEDETGNIIDCISYDVSLLFTVGDIDEKRVYSVDYIETIEIKNWYTDLIRYSGGVKPGYLEYNDSHYIAFKTDKDIDTLLEARVVYKQQKHYYIVSNGDITEKVDDVSDYLYADLSYTDEVAYIGSGWFSRTYEWDRIQSVADFVENEDLLDETILKLSGKEWVLRFVETDFETVSSLNYLRQTWYTIQEVSMLRLKFETDGVVYDLGVVANIQTGDGVPDNNVNIDFEEWFQKFMMILSLILIVVLLLFLGGPLSFILKILWSSVITIVKLVFWVLAIPFRVLGFLFKEK